MENIRAEVVRELDRLSYTGVLQKQSLRQKCQINKFILGVNGTQLGTEKWGGINEVCIINVATIVYDWSLIQQRKLIWKLV